MQPLRFHPILKRARWGGRRLGDQLGKPLGPYDDYAESWEIADRPHDQSVVMHGPLEGRTLSELVRDHRRKLLGAHDGYAWFPLLVKFLDARDRLSVQVHPDDAGALRQQAGDGGKAEAFVVLSAASGSKLYVGLKPGVDRAVLDAAIKDDRVEDVLHSFPATTGEAVLIPPGTVHAVGEGVLLAEVSQSSELTYRLHDWGRLDRDGRPRPLHVAAALGCIDYGRDPVTPVRPESPNGAIHLGAETFAITVRRLSEPWAADDDAAPRIWSLLAGSARLEYDGESEFLARGDTVLLPAERPRTRIVPSPGCTLLEATLRGGA